LHQKPDRRYDSGYILNKGTGAPRGKEALARIL
jgi:hypothetical protein